MTSTTVDVVLFLLLVSGAVVGVQTADLALPVAGGEPPGRADRIADGLSTATTTVNYTLTPGARQADESLVAFGRTDGPEFRRTAHGSYATLLGDVAMARVAFDGRPVTQTGTDLTDGVRSALGRAYLNGRTQVVVVWRPYRGSRFASRTVFGPSPSPDEGVRTATLDVPSGMPPVRERASAHADDGFGAVARVVARATVRGLVPPRRADLALHGDYPVSALVRYRYRRLGALVGANLTDPLAERDPAAANRRLAAALTPQVERQLRQEFDDPAAAANALRLDRVRIAVRVWS
jgi:hypothetical protein